MGNRSKRTLHDLYVIGETVTIPVPEAQWDKPDTSEWITVWVQKLDPLDHDKAVRRGKAARARQRAILADLEGEEYLAIVDMVDQMGVEEMINVAVAEDDLKLQQSARAEKMIDEDSEWAKDDYLSDLLAEWQDYGMAERYAEDPEDVDAVRVIAELNRFEAELAEDLVPLRRDLRDMEEQLPPDELREKVLAELIKQDIEMAFVAEYVENELFFSVRKPCRDCLFETDGRPDPLPHQTVHADYYFESEVRRVDRAVLGRVRDAYDRITMDPQEGKGLRATGSSSASSESPALQETEPSSGQLAAVG